MRILFCFMLVLWMGGVNAATQCVPNFGTNSAWFFQGVAEVSGNTWTRDLKNINTGVELKFKGLAFGCGNVPVSQSFTFSVPITDLGTGISNCCCIMIEPYLADYFLPVQGMDCNNLYDSCAEECAAFYRNPGCARNCDIINYECDHEGA